MTLRSYFGKFTQTSDLLCISQCFIQYPTLSMKPITHVTSEIYLNGIADEKWCTNLFCCWSDFCKSDFFLRLMHVTLPVFWLLHLTLGSIVLLSMLILLRWRLYYKKKFRFEVTKDLKYPQQKYFIQTFCLNMTLCFYRVAVPRHQSASHHIGFSQACPARLGKQHFPANHLLRRKEAVIWLLLGPQVNTLVSWVFSKLWEGEERNLICKGQMEQWKLFPPKDNLGHFYSINFFIFGSNIFS